MMTSSILKRAAPLQSGLQKVPVFSLIACLLLSAVVVRQRASVTDLFAYAETITEDQVDSRLQQAAVASLQQREGTIIVLDPRTGRIRALVNSGMAFERAFAPGSTIKPFTALAAMRFGLSNPPILCRGNYSHREFSTACSHTQQLAPLNTTEAIAYSCNFYFAKLGEHLKEPHFTDLLSQFGFGRRTGINEPSEFAGKLGGEWLPQNALGEGEYLQVTPIQLLMAYAAIVNGGQLLQPRIATANSFSEQLQRRVNITEKEREVIFAGMRGAIRFGTAKKAGLDASPVYIFGKTGTSTPLKGFRPQGWFVGFAADNERQIAQARLGVLVFLKRGQGSEAAETSRKIFAEFARCEGVSRGVNVSEDSTPVPRIPPSTVSVIVYLQRQKISKSLSLEEYLAGVVATEGSTETNVEALKALAVTSRTYALGNLRRHASEGYDFCDMTHCQRFAPIENYDRADVLKAVNATKGEVLKDLDGNLAESYFSASCGGETANIATLWGSRTRSYLSGVNDEYCVTMPHGRWTDVISSTELARALQSDVQKDVGEEVKDILVSRQDQTGRAEQLTIVGSRRRTISGWGLKIIVGRVLGWNRLKSSRFHVFRSGTNFVFRGSGFGHGLGLCQEGAHVMAERGFGYRQILTKYFPGTISGLGISKSYSADLLWSTTVRQSTRGNVVVRQTVNHRATMSSEHFRVSYPVTTRSEDAEYLLQLMENARTAFLARPSFPASVQLPRIEVFVNETTGDFVGRTGLPIWAAAGSQGNRIELQPLTTLRRRGILETTLRHELVHKVIDKVGAGQTPRWLAEGLAVYLAGEGRMVSRFQSQTRLSPEELERKLAIPSDASEMRQLYAAAYNEVRNLIKLEGEAAVWQRVKQGTP